MLVFILLMNFMLVRSNATMIGIHNGIVVTTIAKLHPCTLIIEWRVGIGDVYKRQEAESLADSGFPLEVFPQKMQSIIIDMVVHGNFKVDYVAMSMLSAASAALGNTYRIHVKQDWDLSLIHI